MQWNLLACWIASAPALAQVSASGDLHITVTSVRFIGNQAISSADLDEMARPYRGGPLTLAKLERLAEAVTEAYRARGYSLARAFVPDQEVRGGVVEILVVEGRVGRLQVEGNRYYSEAFIRQYFEPVLEDQAFKMASLERALLLLNNYQDLQVLTVLEPGQAVGTTDLTAKVTDRLPLHWVLDYNNFGVPSVSTNRYGFGVEAGNVLGAGNTLTLNGISGEDSNRLLFFMGSYAVTLGGQGTRFVASASTGRFDVGGELAELGVRGKITTYDLSVDHPLVKSRGNSVMLEVGIVAKDNRLFIAGETNSQDRLRMAKVGVSGDATDARGRTSFSVYAFQGLGPVLGAMNVRTGNEGQASANNQYTKGVVATGHMQNLPYGILLLRGTGQVSTGSLPVIEKMLLGGADSVRGYLMGQQIGDQGFTVSGELRLPLPKFDFITGTLFFDSGAVQQRSPGVGEKAYANLTGCGMGLRIGEERSLHVRLELGFPLVPDKSVAGSLSGGSSPVAYVQALARF